MRRRRAVRRKTCHTTGSQVVTTRYGASSTQQLPRARQPDEPPLQRVDVGEVAADIVVAAVLAGREAKAAPCVGVAWAGSAQVDHGRQILLLLERGGIDPLAFERL